MEKMQWGEDPEFLGPKHWFRQSLIISEISKIKRSGLILDFGCGSGTLLTRLGSLGFRGIGLDTSRQAVNYFSQQIDKNGLKDKITAEIGNEKSLSSKKYSNKLDGIIASEVLEHLRDDRAAVKAFYQALKKEGICIITVPAHPYLWDINDDFSSHYRRYEKERLIKIFTQAGFKVKKIYYWGFPISFLWHKLIFLPLIDKKRKTKIRYTHSKSLLGKLLSYKLIKRLAALPFFIDQLFNWTNKGGSLFLVAEKS